MEPSSRQLTYGERLFKINFDSKEHSVLFEIKCKYAKLINQLDELRTASKTPEQKRHFSVAITETQTACNWACNAFECTI